MRVLIVRNSDAPTNASMRRVASALIEAGHTPIILSRTRVCDSEVRYIEKKMEVEGVEVSNFELQLEGKTERGLKNFTVLKTYMNMVESWMRDNKDAYDAIHAFDLDNGLIANKISKKYKKYFVYHIADFYVDSRSKIPEVLKKLIRALEFRVINSADHTIICTEERREQIKGAKPKKLTVVHNTPVIDFEVEEITKASEKISLCYIGNLSKRRFIDQILEIVARRPEIELNLAGSADLAEMAREYSETYPNIHFYGKVDYDQTFELYLKSDLMFAIYNPNINNHRYSAANKIYEAMLLKKPIIVAKDTSMDKMVEKYDIGFTMDYTQEAFEEILDKIEANPSIIEEKSRNMIGIYKEFSWREMKDRLKNIYCELGKEI